MDTINRRELSVIALPGVLDGQLIIPVVTIHDASTAPHVVAALAAGGIGCVEITLRTSSALEAIAAAAATETLHVGAGTVLTAEDVDRVAEAGARFVISPGLDERVVSRATDLGLAVLPGAATATEAQRALTGGLGAVKFFPADQLGGLNAVAALAQPFPTLAFVPSGGVSPLNAARYLRHPAVPAVSGSWLAPSDVLAARDYRKIEKLSREAARLVKEVQG
ncbi:bifunctional 4-hydroxy-2-oxoglutarate aldolase/2-dehydro-3-deoxy-phosphogluconate aldolase [Microbacterium lacus]|uniref:2-dehydro-3-deoxy-phosphogluconate aldolase n=1 Tax=Microbacterium lacus TaxID=415217 RepID=A0ABN2HEH0_9MICO